MNGTPAEQVPLVRLAATVMLVRPAGDENFEVLMLRRSEASHFVPDVYVFPGGTVDAQDLTDQAFARTRGIEPDTLRRQFRAKHAPEFPAPFGTPHEREAAALLIAAARELFEEAGVLLACDVQGRPLSQNDLAPHRDRLHAARPAVHAGEVSFAQLLADLDLYANANALALFSQWITPPVFPRRYNAHFFVAVASPDQTALADAFETHDGLWIAPRTALQRCELGEFRMVYPTIKHVERLAAFDDVWALMEFARTKTIYSIMPDTPAERQFSLPSDLEFAW
jgi:8-oxo-dGTP pyrophosphatase MutT (NUDIX family)